MSLNAMTLTDSMHKLRKCLEHAIALVKPGARYRDLGDAVSRHAKSNG